MSNGFSRAKGKRGELDVVHKLGGSAKRVGHSYIATPVDVESSFARYSVKNKTVGGSLIASEISRLEIFSKDGKNSYIAFKVRGKWWVAESMKQHQDDHSDRELSEHIKRPSSDKSN